MLKFDMEEFERTAREQWGKAGGLPPELVAKHPSVQIQVRNIDVQIALAKFVITEMERSDTEPDEIVKAFASIVASTMANTATMIAGANGEQSLELMETFVGRFVPYYEQAAVNSIRHLLGAENSGPGQTATVGRAEIKRKDVGDA